MRKRILIVEDHPTIQHITAKLLQAQNYEVEIANDGIKGLDMVDTTHFDMILLDIDIPSIDGMAYTQKIRSMSDPIKSQIPIIAITGNTRNYTASDFQTVGINEYMLKPINFTKLIEKLDGFFNE